MAVILNLIFCDKIWRWKIRTFTQVNFLFMLFGWGIGFDCVLRVCCCCFCHCLGQGGLLFCFCFVLFCFVFNKTIHVLRNMWLSICCACFSTFQLHQSISDFHDIIAETNSNATLTHLHISLVHTFPFKIYSENAKKKSCLPLPIVSISSICLLPMQNTKGTLKFPGIAVAFSFISLNFMTLIFV